MSAVEGEERREGCCKGGRGGTEGARERDWKGEGECGRG